MQPLPNSVWRVISVRVCVEIGVWAMHHASATRTKCPEALVEAAPVGTLLLPAIRAPVNLTFFVCDKSVSLLTFGADKSYTQASTRFKLQ